MSALRSLSPLCTIGTRSASDGASIELTKVVCRNEIKHLSKQRNTGYAVNKRSSATLPVEEYQESILYTHLDLEDPSKEWGRGKKFLDSV